MNTYLRPQIEQRDVAHMIIERALSVAVLEHWAQRCLGSS